MDDFLLAAMREVDAMLPDTPPIAPPRWSAEQVSGARGLANQRDASAMLLEQMHGLLNQHTDTYADGTHYEELQQRIIQYPREHR